MDTSVQGKRLLVINSCGPHKAFAYKKIYEMGISLIVLHEKKADRLLPYVDERIFADVYNHDESLEAVKDYIAAGNTIDGVITFREESVLLTSKITDMLGMIGIPYEVASVLKNKHLFKKNNESSLYNKSVMIQSHDDVYRLGEELGYPVVMKPAFGADSSLVIKASDEQEALSIFDHILARIEFDEYAKDGREIIAEKYMDGKEVDIDILIQNGKVIYHAITDNDPTNEPYFMEAGRSIPSQLPLKAQEELLAATEHSLIAVGVTNGLFNMEAKYTSDTGAEMLEANIRLGGMVTPLFSKDTRGVDLVENAAKIALGIPCVIEKSPHPLSYQICKFLNPVKSGTISRIDVSPSVKDTIREITLIKNITEKVVLPPGGFDYIGWVSVQESDFAAAQKKMDAVLAGIDIEIV